MNNPELLKEVEGAAAFLRTCGSKRGVRQSNQIVALCARFRIYESKLVQFHMSTHDIMENACLDAEHPKDT